MQRHCKQIEYAELRQMIERTWDALDVFDLDPADSKNVNRWEKLCKLYAALSKQLAKLDEKKPDQKQNALDQFLTGTFDN